MDNNNTFQRRELKYLLDPWQKSAVFSAMQGHMQGDRYPDSAISNIYFDTPDFLLIRRSLEKPIYKEKLRMRSYGIAKEGGTVFVELKKKYRSMVYKRRVPMELSQAESYLSYNPPTGKACQIRKEIDYFLDFYQPLQPAMFLSYQREAFVGIQEQGLRVTFDKDILWRREQITLRSGAYGVSALEPGFTLMEVKAVGAIPLWLAKVFSENGIYKTSFSKYGRAYSMALQERLQGMGGMEYA